MIYFAGPIPSDDHRKTKNDKKAKRDYCKYKKGGHSRVNEKKKDEK